VRALPIEFVELSRTENYGDWNPFMSDKIGEAAMQVGLGSEFDLVRRPSFPPF